MNEVRLGAIAEFINGRPFKPHEWSDTGLPIIRIQNLNGGQDYNYYQGEYSPKVLIKKGDLLFAWSGSRGTSFGPHIWKWQDGLLNYHTWKVEHSDLVDRLFLFYALKIITVLVENEAHGAAALVHMQKQNIVNFKIPLPPLPEQRKIADILSTWDEAITQTEQLIAALQTRKKGLMQKLLTGEVRFPGFEGEWIKVNLGNIGSFEKGSGIQKSDLVESGIPCIRYGEIYTTHHFVIKQFHSFITPEVASSSKRIFEGDILFAGSGETAEEIGKCVAFVGNENAYAGGDVIILRLSKGNPTFLGYLLNHQTVKNQKAKMGQGYSVVHIYSRYLKDIKILFPPIDEQEKIAEVFQACDQEIDLHTQKLAALQQQKKGLMQRLLAGEVRV